MQISKLASVLGLATLGGAALAQAPQYSIIDLGVIGTSASQAFAISNNGAAIGGRTVTDTVDTPLTWNAAGQMTVLPQLPGKTSGVVRGINDSGVAVGNASVTPSGLNSQPVVWQNGTVTQLTTAGRTTGHAYAINDSGVIAGSVGGGTNEVAAVYRNGAATVIPAMSNGNYMTTAYGINNAGLVVGVGIDANDAARNVGMVYDTNTGSMIDIGGVPGKNGAIPFAISSNGIVAGASMQGQGDAVPFMWTAAGGMQAIPLLANTSYGQASGVNASGWVVGSDGGQYSNPFLYANGTLYSIASLVAGNADWDFSTNTAASAASIADNGSIVGTAFFDGVAHAYEMVLTPSAVPETSNVALMLAGLCLVGGVARRRATRVAA